MRFQIKRSWVSLTRAVGASALVATVGLLPPSTATPVSAADPDPLNRVVLKVNSIKVIDDSDWGEGEMEYTARIQRISPSCGGLCANEKFEYIFKFGADSGETRSFVGKPEAIVPAQRTQPATGYVQPQPGLALFAGDSLRVRFVGNESDPAFDDYVGSFTEDFTQAQSWGRGPAHITESRDTLGFGGFQVNYEIVLASLPDLIVSDIRVGNFADNGDDIVCVTVQNGGAEPAGPYTLKFFVDGVVPRNGQIVEAGVLQLGATQERCFQSTIAAGQHNFAATVDTEQTVPEIDELNNTKGLVATILRRTVAGGVLQPGGPMGGVLEPAGDSAPDTSPSQADLIASKLLVKGKEPESDGQSDCDPGKNDVTVTLKNQGGTDAAAFAVTLLVDGDEGDGGKETVQSLAKGAETTVRFDDARLKKGSHELKVRVDSEQKIAESSESNNELSQTVSCKNEDD